MAARPAIFDVLGLGCTAVDELLYVAAYPPADSKEQVLRRARQCGGVTAMALVAAARLGARSAFAGVLGDDEDSRFVLDKLTRAGVDVSHRLVCEGTRPIRAVIVVDEQRRTRTIFYDLAGACGADSSQPAAPVIQSACVLLVDHFGVEGMTRAARIARAAGIPVVGDFESDEGPGFAELLKLVDHLIIPRGLAARLTGENEPAAAVDALWRQSRQLVAVTSGVEGLWYRGATDQGPPRHQPAFRVPEVDTTGCGDVFHGAYAAALAWGWKLQERLRFASAAAALKATRSGGPDACPTREAVERFLSEHT
jgi:sulfofructose kinase